MSLDVPQSSHKRHHESFSENCVIMGDATTASFCLGENNQPEFDISPAVPVFSVETSVSSKSSVLEIDVLNQPPLKKTKLLEHDVKKYHEETKGVGKLEEKARKEKEREIERLRKEAERKKKEADREEKRTAYEIEKLAREEKRRKVEEEKRKKEEERKKKERSQMKLGSFFAAPFSSKTREGLTNMKAQSSLNPPSSIDYVKFEASLASEKSIKPISPYSKLFPDFFIQNGVTLAPSNRSRTDQKSLKQAQENIDECITGSQILEKPPKIRDTLNLPSEKCLPRGRAYRSTRQIMKDFYHERLNSKNVPSIYHASESIFKSIPIKSLKFYEDVRPPYIGTYSCRPIHGIAKLARNPLRKDLPNVDYDYDSEAEWLEDEEGEDLQSDDEEEDIDDVEDIDGFLDDEDDENPRSRQFDLNGDLEPISTGICWEDCEGRNPNVELENYRIEFILDQEIKSIDPLSKSYWPSLVISDIKPNGLKNFCSKSQNHNGAHNPSASKNEDLMMLTATTNQVCDSKQVNLKKLKKKEILTNNPSTKLIAPEDMEEFKTAVVGSDLSKIGLIEVLKKKFPGRPAAAIKATLELIARRGQKGQKEAEKRWALV
ncbi:putative chromatin assembly factor 1 subunit a [Erysiphe necator]|uniref:Putative chromatin assembly factor 1 subunit a n=1 Tax=Uncinula necator TaxID=52586 RepID=A0A0B1P7E5_UNCNE|nr:putative chromatin assembly factor 1 subunit a [Erysiphe necator]